MIKIIPILLLLSGVQPQLFRPDVRQRPVSFLRPPQRFHESPHRFQAAPSNIETEVREPPPAESFISGATPFVQRPRPIVGALPRIHGPSFDLVPPPSAKERNVEGNILQQGQLHQNEIEEIKTSDNNKYSPIPDSLLDENYDEEVPAREEEITEEKLGTEEAQQPSEAKNLNNLEGSLDESPSDSFSPFSFAEEVVTSEDPEDGRTKKREANPQNIGTSFKFPNFHQGANLRQFQNLDSQDIRANGQQNAEPRRPENQFLPPIYRPDQNSNFRQPEASASRPLNLNGFNPPSFAQEEKPKNFGFSDHRLPLEGQVGHKSEFNFNQNINSPNRPTFHVRHERPSPSELQESTSPLERLERPFRLERPSLPERHERPSQPERHERPSQPERHERPQPERHERPQPERHERPSQPERQERPSQPERQERPSPSIRHERPSPPEHPKRPESLFPIPDHRSELRGTHNFQFPSFSEAQSNAKPFIPAAEIIQTPPRIIGQQQLKKGIIKRKPFKKRQQDPLYQASDIEQNQLFQGYQEDEEDETPDRLSTLLQETGFNCLKRKNGYYADEELSCEVFHFCQDGVKHSWLCPNGGSFHQVHLICLPRSEDNICEKSSKFHFVNDYLYQLAGEGKNKSYVQRYYPDGYTEGIATLEERHSISEQAPPPPKHSQAQQYRVPQQPPRNLYQFNQQQEPPRQVQLGPTLKQVQRHQFAGSEDYQDGNLQQEQQYEETNDYPAEEEFQHRTSPSFRPFPNYKPGRPTAAIASQIANQ